MKRYCLLLSLVLAGHLDSQITETYTTVQSDANEEDLPPPVDPDVLSTLVRSDQTGGPSLSLGQAMALALQNNFTRKISQENVSLARAAVDQARGPVLPQVGIGVTYQQVNEDQTQVQAGFSPENQTSLDFTASQMIYDDSQVTDFRTSRRELEAAQEADDSVKLDVVEETGIAYVSVLSIASSLRIAEDNLRITRENLELSRIRRDIGTAGPEEVLRFESEEAQQESTLWSTRSLLHSAVNDLNRALGEPPDRSWTLEDLSLDTNVFRTTLSVLIPLANTQQSSDQFRVASIQFALARSPELSSLNFSADAQRLRLAESRRSFFVPEVSASFVYSQILDSEYTSGALGATDEEDTWTFLVGATLPLFEGGSRFGDARQARAEVRSLEFQEARLRQTISVNVSNSLSDLASSWQSIRLSRIAADRAQENLRIVQDKYEQGSVSNIDLLDAQNNALVQRQTASIELYRFFEDLISYQRSLSWAEPLADNAAREEFVESFTALMNGG
ncbi:MAG: TolC family protein [Verrucomicrobiota bacterium]